MITEASLTRARSRAGITLTEILIAILILAVGLASLATLFPLGLLRLREAARSTRSAYLMESAAADIVSRGLLTSSSFTLADQYNLNSGGVLTPWFITRPSFESFNPLTQDTPGYVQPSCLDWKDATTGAILGASTSASGGYGLPFAYDPLWRFQTFSKLTGQTGYYIGDTYEARFGSGLGFIRPDPAADGSPPSAHGLQRLTNFNRPFYVNAAGGLVPVMPVSSSVPGIFVSPEDVVWAENVSTDASSTAFSSGLNAISPVLPDLSLPAGATNITTKPVTTNTPATPVVNDWHYSWMFTGQQNNTGSSSTFDGNIVIFENRPFAIEVPELIPNPPGGNFQAYQVEGETVVEAIWGYSSHVSPAAGPGYGTSADRAVLLRWYASLPDPVVRVGDWIADVTYERQQNVVYNPTTASGRFLSGGPPGLGVPNPFNNNEWDNLPAQRCFWYRVQKAGTPAADSLSTDFRSMVVYVDRTLQARTLLSGTGQPTTTNAALICPYVVNVIPQTIFTR
jgi:hypothetical protein